MNTKNLLLLITLVGTIATMQAAEIKPVDTDKAVEELIIEKEYKDKATQIHPGQRQAPGLKIANYTRLHELIFNPPTTTISASPKNYAALATFLVKNGCPLDTELTFIIPSAWHRKTKTGEALHKALQPYDCIPTEGFTFAGLVREIMDIDSKPWKEKFLSSYPTTITDKPTLVAVCKGVLEGKKDHTIPMKLVVNESLPMLSLSLTNIITEYTDEELAELAKLKELVQKHQ